MKMSVTEDRTKLGKFLKMRFLRGTYVFDQKIMDKLTYHQWTVLSFSVKVLVINWDKTIPLRTQKDSKEGEGKVESLGSEGVRLSSFILQILFEIMQTQNDSDLVQS